MSLYAGHLLRLDLTSGKWSTQTLSAPLTTKWLLGSGLAAKIFFDEMDAAVDPLDATSPLIILNGLLTGTFAPAACRTSWCGRSPLTGIWNESNMGGYWGAELRFAGYDGLVITGRANTPVYLWINGIDKVVEIRDASHMWGSDYFETADRLLAETDAKAKISGIGQAGENLVRIAGIMTGPSHGVRAAGRGGMGALLGSKNLKAIVVRGRDRPQYARREQLRDEVRDQAAVIKDHTTGMSYFGTAGGVGPAEKTGDLPVRNWTLGSWDGAERVSGQTIYASYLVKHSHCFACPIGCGKEIEVSGGEWSSPRGEGVEYETIAGFGSSLLNDNAESVILANSLCNRYGLDTISTSSVIAFATEAYEAGLIGDRETHGLELGFGNPDAVIALIKRIAFRHDIGDLLGQGVRTAAQVLGPATESMAVHVKGLEIAYHDPRAFVSMAVNYATAARGGCHLEGLTYWNGYGVVHPNLRYPERLDPHRSSDAQARMACDYQNFYSVFNPLGLCKFIAKGGVGPERVCQLVNHALGWDWSVDDLLEVGERIFQLKRLINLRLGVTAEDDCLPERLVTQPRPDGDAAGVLPDLDLMLPEYYRLRGWTGDGKPSETRLAELGLADEGRELKRGSVDPQ